MNITSWIEKTFLPFQRFYSIYFSVSLTSFVFLLRNLEIIEKCSFLVSLILVYILSKRTLYHVVCNCSFSFMCNFLPT